MVLIRAFERKLDFLFRRGLITGTSHVCVGQEAVPVALAEALEDDDLATGTHRGHGLALVKGVAPEALMAEIMGRASGVCGGRGGSQHVARAETGFLGTNGITCGGLPIAAGAAFACAYRGERRIVAAMLGDGATNEGIFHETLNIASLWRLPILFVCENNLYGMSTSVDRASAEPLLWKRAEAHRIDSRRLDGNDLEALLPAFAEAARRVREERRPAFLECMTYRWLGHSKSDARVYRSREEEAEWRERCPIKRWREKLARGGIEPGRLDAVERQIKREIDTIADQAMQAPEPEPGTLEEHVHA